MECGPAAESPPGNAPGYRADISDEMRAPHSPAVGLSVGTGTLAAVTATHAVTGRPVVTRAGRPIGDFVDRVGDPVGIVAADGSLHSGAALLADALRELARTASPGQPLPTAVAVAYPGHWGPAAVEALRRALRRIPIWSADSAQLVLVPDYAAALTALRANPGLPARGVVAVCDFGGSATTITLVDLADDFRAIGASLRHPDFSGDLIDRALLTHVLAAAGVTPGTTGTSAIGALTQLRAECRAAKERLSARTVTAVPGGPAGLRCDIRLTRPELDELLREPMAGVVATVQDSLRRKGIAPAQLAAVVSVGGGAAAPAVISTLSEHLRVPVITARQPGLAAANGAALRAARATADDGATVITFAPAVPQPASPGAPAAALAWSQASDIPELVPQLSQRVVRTGPRAQLDFAPESAPAGVAPTPWHRRPLLIVAAALVVIAGAGGATALALRAGSTSSPAQPAPGVSAPAEGPVEAAPSAPSPAQGR